MIKIVTFLILITAVAGCTSMQSSLDEQYPDRVQVNPPQRVPYEERPLHIRSVERIQFRNNYALVIEGDFPNPCTQILRVNDNRFAQTNSFEIIGWQKYEEMCAQMITPFTFIYENQSMPLRDLETVTVNGTAFKLENSDSQNE